MAYKRPSSEVTCEQCGVIFLKENREIQRCEAAGTAHMCSRKCGSKTSHKASHGEAIGFGYYVTQSRKRYKNRPGHLANEEFDIDARYLKALWDKQGGRCVLSGIPMQLNSHRLNLSNKSPFYASLDRIDNSRGYVKGNVQFVCLSINYMRNTFTVEQAKDFIRKLKESKPDEHAGTDC